MPRKYVLVSSSSSTEISSLYSTENSDSEPELLKESRNRRARRRGRDVQCRRSEEPQEGLHWWLARWLSSEFAKFAVSVYEGGKGCIRYLSNTALHALSSARTAIELQEEVSRSRAQRSRHRHRRRRNSPYPGVSAEVLKVRKSRNRGSRYGRKERPSSPNETYSPLVHRKASKHGHRLQVSAKKQDVCTNTVPSSEENLSKSTAIFIKSNLPLLRSMAEDVASEKLNQWLQTSKEGDGFAEMANKITRLSSNLICFLDEIKIRVDLDSEVLDMQRETLNDLATKTDIEKIRSTQSEGFSALKMKEEDISETQSFLMNKLVEINSLVQRQIQEQEKLERTRTNSEVSFKQKLDFITSLLQSDLVNIKSAVKEIEAGEMGSKKRSEVDAEKFKDRPTKNRNE